MKLSMKQIAADLREIAATLPEVSFDEKRTVYTNGGFSIKCMPTREAVETVAAKYQKARNMTTREPTRSCVSTSTPRAAARIFCQDGEYWNAVNIAPCVFGKTKTMPIPLVDVEEFEPGIVAARMYYQKKLSQWNVTQVVSGMTCGCSGSSKAEAISLFEKVRANVAEHTCDDYQNEAREFYTKYQTEVMGI